MLLGVNNLIHHALCPAALHQGADGLLMTPSCSHSIRFAAGTISHHEPSLDAPALQAYTRLQ